ncbi:MAG: DMT family transporter [Bacillota bacterium]|uniref:DMT family transporter n=1 Tax=Desulforudis sp. DRI-14 TaxID=3459793 RepID=UPI00348AD598
MKNEVKGFLFVAAAAMLWGLAGTVAKYMFNQDVRPVHVAEMRAVLSFLLLFVYLAVANRKCLWFARSDLLFMAVFGMVGVAGVQVTYLMAIKETNVATAIFLQYLAPALVLVYGVLRRAEQLTLCKLAALALAVGGGYLIVTGKVGGGLATTPLGLAYGLASAAFFAFYTLFGKKGLEKYGAWTLTVYGYGFAAVLWCFVQNPVGVWLAYNWTERLFFVYIAVFATVLPFGFFFEGLKYLSPTKTGIISTLEPVVAAVLAFLLLGERLALMQIAGCGLILAAVVLIQTRPGAPEQHVNETVGDRSELSAGTKH